MRLAFSTRLIVVLGVVAATSIVGSRPAFAQAQNLLPARILGMFDIDGKGGADSVDTNGDGVADVLDTDFDGLPDTWEVGGLDPQQTDVPFPAPTAIVPGTPPTPLFARRAVRTSASSRDTDGDGLSDFVEVFGLKFIDDNGNGVLDPDEWADLNGDGMPSIGEFPLANLIPLANGGVSAFDYDGFVFTDPTNADTDGDGLLDGEDPDPLINPRAFGQRAPVTSAGDADFDNDGLGDNMDMGNDERGEINNPTDLRRLLELFRPDIIATAGTNIRIPEGLIEDLLGADWNGDGLFRLNDIDSPVFGFVTQPSFTVIGNIDLFQIENPVGGITRIPLGLAPTVRFPSNFDRTVYMTAARRGTGGVNPGLPFQTLLRPTSRNENVFLPDPRIWTVLYSWRMPGFDIDGNGFIGFDSATITPDRISAVDDQGRVINDANATNLPSSELPIAASTANPKLDGAISVTFANLLCPFGAVSLMLTTLLGLRRFSAWR
ncbi:MAG: hypothetical protein U1D55_00635 [Phycisphaerae bacterium]